EIFERGHPNVWAVARLAPGRTLGEAQTELDAISARLAAEFPVTNKGVQAAAVSLRDQVAGDVRPSLLTILAAVVVVLLIACANIANLQLSRAVSREREMSLRSALGASRSRIVRQLLTENLLICGVAGVLGIGIAEGGTRVLAAAVDDKVQVFGTIDVDAGVVAFVFALMVVTALVCGISPAWHASRASARSALAQRAPDGAGGAARRTLVVAELALSLVLLVGAGLLARTIERLGREEPGFAPSNVLTFQFRLPRNRYDGPAKRTAFFERALDNVRGVAGVASAALITSMPFTGNWGLAAYQTDRSEAPPSTGGPTAQSNGISDGYFGTMQIPLLAGRDFDARDRIGSERVAIVNAEFVRREFPDGDALGRRVRLVGGDVDGEWLTIAGVVGNAKQLALTDAPTPQVYVPIRQAPDLFCNVVARTMGDPLASATAVRAAIWAVDPDQPVWSIHSMDELLARSTSRLRLTTALGSAFAGAGLLLALIGVYAVMSFMVAQRTREVGIRIAVGAKPAQVIAMILGDGLRLTLVAIAIGWLVALGATRLLASQLFGVGAIDPPTYLGIALLLGAVALFACWLPARRAARVDPNVALRYE
ncbi:MAG TPA: ABC transporter permease, partial [Rhodanobacteraceae bacterium]|nr:ABC transporter permease [Rhodanobacteraceae bacterium]